MNISAAPRRVHVSKSFRDALCKGLRYNGELKVPSRLLQQLVRERNPHCKEILLRVDG